MKGTIQRIDFGSLELRLLDRNQPSDPHRAKAAEIFVVHPEGVTDEQRRYARVINYREWYSQPKRTL